MPEYKADYEKAIVTRDGVEIATFNTANGEYVPQVGIKKSRWIQEAILEQRPMAASIVGEDEIHPADVEDVRYGNIHFDEVFPHAPKPKDNKVGRNHPEIYEWIEKSYPKFVEVLYPNGKYDLVKAGLKGLKGFKRGKEEEISG